MKTVAFACLLLLAISQALAFIPSNVLQHMGVNTHNRDLCETRAKYLNARRSLGCLHRKCCKRPTDIQLCRMIVKAQLSETSAERKMNFGRRELVQAFFLTTAASSLAGPKYTAAEVHTCG